MSECPTTECSWWSGQSCRNPTCESFVQSAGESVDPRAWWAFEDLHYSQSAVLVVGDEGDHWVNETMCDPGGRAAASPPTSALPTPGVATLPSPRE